MLSVRIIEPVAEKPLSVVLSRSDINLVKEIRDKIGFVQAIKVFRLMCGCSLLDAKNYVEEEIK